ncbi:VanZ family protein [Geodermatophilus sp. CPCC 206100]|uniref:VanZ family protein n=1 Tax=Geodermatophilus sp. CPCC 206100 TaxID=3020054 RepID=UPI003B00BC09
MDDDRRRVLDVALLCAGLAVAVLTLTPTGAAGWAWGAPLTELRWYATGLESRTTLFQLLGNLALLAPLAALAVLRWPALGTPHRLVVVAVAVAGGVELLQWALPLGRVVSPVDAALNVTGAVLAGLLAAAAIRVRRAPAGA